MEGRRIVDVGVFDRFLGVGFFWFGFFFFCGVFQFFRFCSISLLLFHVSKTKVYGKMTFFL